MKEVKNNLKLAKVLTAYIVNDNVLRDTLLLRDENTRKRYMFDTFRKEVANTCKDEMMVAAHNGKECEIFNENELRSFMRDNKTNECRVNYYRKK